jgi:hypothetical protein
MREVRGRNNSNLKIQGIVRSVSPCFSVDQCCREGEDDIVSCAEGSRVMKIMDMVRREGRGGMLVIL